MNALHWLTGDIIGLRRRTFPERRCNAWRALGWALALVPWALLIALWWLA